MGVHGLWELLAPVGRRVSVETLAGKRLAIGTPLTQTLATLSYYFFNSFQLFRLFVSRRQYMDHTVYEGNERREGRDGTERSHTGILPSNLQASVPQD